MRLPVFETLRNGAILAGQIGRRHLGVLIAFAALYSIIHYDGTTSSLVRSGEPSMAEYVLRGFLVIVGSLILVILVHREILVGPTSIRSMISRPALSRMGWYFLDLLAIVGVVLVPVVVATIAILVTDPPWAGGPPFAYLWMFGLFFVAAFIGARLWLKLPARAIDEPLTWRQVWALGRGNNLRLFVVVFLTDSLLSWLASAITGAIAPASPILAQLINSIYAVASPVLVTAWLSVAYLYLTVGDPAAPAETDA